MEVTRQFKRQVINDFIFHWKGMTALETWCLAMIGLVFEALLAYVVVLFWLFRERALQAKKLIFRKIKIDLLSLLSLDNCLEMQG